MFCLCSYIRILAKPRSCLLSRLGRSIFDIVYQAKPNGTDRRPIPLAPRNLPVNFMGLFPRFEKT
jgi:hypothetical protein